MFCVVDIHPCSFLFISRYCKSEPFKPAKTFTKGLSLVQSKKRKISSLRQSLKNVAATGGQMSKMFIQSSDVGYFSVESFFSHFSPLVNQQSMNPAFPDTKEEEEGMVP